MKTLFNPANDSLLIRTQTKVVASMAVHFKSLRHDVDATRPWTGIQNALADAIVHSRVAGYRKAALVVGRSPNSMDIMRLRKEGIDRAEWVASEMQGWTKQSLQASKKSKLLSHDRAQKVGDYEFRKAFFDGTVLGGKLNKATKKSWLTSSLYHDVDDQCDDNEDDGIIEIGDVFTTGDAGPPAHLWCYCSLWLHVG